MLNPVHSEFISTTIKCYRYFYCTYLQFTLLYLIYSFKDTERNFQGIAKKTFNVAFFLKRTDFRSAKGKEIASRLRLTPNGKRQAAVCSKMLKLVFLVLTSLFFVFVQ